MKAYSKFILKSKSIKVYCLLCFLLALFSVFDEGKEQNLSQFHSLMKQEEVWINQNIEQVNYEKERVTGLEKSAKGSEIILLEELKSDFQSVKTGILSSKNYQDINKQWCEYQIRKAARLARLSGVKKFHDEDPLILYQSELEQFPSLYDSNFNYDLYLEADVLTNDLTAQQAHYSKTERARVNLEYWLKAYDLNYNTAIYSEKGPGTWALNLMTNKSVFGLSFLFVFILFIGMIHNRTPYRFMGSIPIRTSNSYLQEFVILFLFSILALLFPLLIIFLFLGFRYGFSTLQAPVLFDSNLLFSYKAPNLTIVDFWYRNMPLLTYLGGSEVDHWFPSFVSSHHFTTIYDVLHRCFILLFLQMSSILATLKIFIYKRKSTITLIIGMLLVIMSRYILLNIPILFPPVAHLLAGGSGLGFYGLVIVSILWTTVTLWFGAYRARRVEVKYE